MKGTQQQASSTSNRVEPTGSAPKSRGSSSAGWTQYMGRITYMDPPSSESAEGVLTLVHGATVRWTARASLTDLYADLFSGTRVVAAGTIGSDGSLWIASIRPVIASEWEERVAELIANRHSNPSDDPHEEARRRASIKNLLSTLTDGSAQLTPSLARRTSKEKRVKKEKLAQRDGLECHYCHRRFGNLSEARIDHAAPKTLFPTWDLSALVLACPPCHKAKGERFPLVMALMLARFAAGGAQ